MDEFKIGEEVMFYRVVPSDLRDSIEIHGSLFKRTKKLWKRIGSGAAAWHYRTNLELKEYVGERTEAAALQFFIEQTDKRLERLKKEQQTFEALRTQARSALRAFQD